MDGIVISTERIATTAAGVAEVGGRLAAEINAMDELLEQIRAGWQSDAAAPQFAAGMRGYLDQARQLKDALLSHGATLSSTAAHFAEAEEGLAQGLRGSR